MPFLPPYRRTSRKPRTPEPGGEAAGAPGQDAEDDEQAEAPEDAAAGTKRDEAALRLQEAMRRKQCALGLGLALPSFAQWQVELDEAPLWLQERIRRSLCAPFQSLCCTLPCACREP